MDFLNNHAKITKKEFENITKIVIEKFQYLYQEGRSFDYAIKALKISINNDFLESDEFKNYNLNFRELSRIFINAINTYTTGDKIHSALKNELFEAYEDENRRNKNNNVACLLTFEEFVPILLKFYVYLFIEQRLIDNEELYRIFYENNDYNKFTIESFKSHVVESAVFIKIFKEFYPNKPLPIVIKEKNEFRETERVVYPDKNLIEKKDQKNLKKSTEYNEILEKLSGFDDEEKYLLIHTVYKNLCPNDITKKEFPLTEFFRFIIICQNITDISIFEDKYANKPYKIVSEGLQYFPKRDKQINLKRTTLEKIEDLKVPKIQEMMKFLKI